jgi:Ca2+-binding EF-hand superfamily protein
VLEYKSFERAMAAKLGEKDKKEELLKAFKLFDDAGTGRVRKQTSKLC